MSTKGKKYLEMFESGMTYKQIADQEGVPRGYVARDIHTYRKKNKIPANQKKQKKAPSKKEKKQTGRKNRIIPLTPEEKKLVRARKKELEQCERLQDGTIKCPPMKCMGYGIEQSYLEKNLGYV